MPRIDEENARQYFIENFFDLETDLPMINKTIELQEIVYTILKEFIRVCKVLRLKPYPIFGTLLGIVRHQGFVPWDDDVDMGLFRDDYEIFKNEGRSILLDNYEILDLSKDQSNYRGSYLRLMYKLSTAIEVKNQWDKEIINGIWIDILPIDCMYDEDKLNNDKIRKIRDVQQMLRCKLYNYDEKRFKTTKEKYTIFSEQAKAHTVNFLQNRIKELALEGDQKSRKVGVCVLNGQEEYYDIFYRDDFLVTEKRIFKDIEIEIPHGYERILRERYGQAYMKYPPIHQRIPHHKCFYSFNVPYEKYRKRFITTFKNKENRKVILFGAGHISLTYLNRFGLKQKPEFVVDNDPNKWHKKLSEITFTNMPIEAEFAKDKDVLTTDLGNLEIKKPEILCNIEDRDYHLIICSSYFREIENQIRNMGIKEYSIFVQKKEWLLIM